MITLIEWLMNLWYGRLRRIDIEILWPQCKRHAKDIDHAKAAFMFHAMNDSAWKFLGEEEIKRRIDDLV